MQPDSPAIMAAAMNAVDRSFADKRDTTRNAGNLNDGPFDENVIAIGNLPERRMTFQIPQYSPAPKAPGTAGMKKCTTVVPR